MPRRRRSWGRVASPTHATKGYKRTDIQTHRQQNRQRDSCWRGSRIARVAARISRTACSLRSHCLCWLRSQSQQRASRGRRGWMCSGDAALSARGGRGRCLEAKRTRTGPHVTQHVVAGALGCLTCLPRKRRKVGRGARARRAVGSCGGWNVTTFLSRANTKCGTITAERRPASREYTLRTRFMYVQQFPCKRKRLHPLLFHPCT